MAIQVINDPNRTFGSSLGNALSTGLGQGINALAALKLEELSANAASKRAQKLKMASQQEESQAYQSLGIDPTMANALASLGDPKLKQTIASNLSPLAKVPADPYKAANLELQQYIEQGRRDRAAQQAKLSQEAELGRQSRHAASIAEKKETVGKKIEEGKVKLASKEYADIVKGNKAFNETLDTEIKAVPELETLISDLDKLVDQVFPHGIASLIPTRFRGTKAQQLEQKANQIVTLLAPPGQTTNEQMKLVQSLKPNLKSSRATNKESLKALKEMVNLRKARNKFRKQLIAENNGKQPSDLAFKVEELIEKQPSYKKFIKNAEPLLAKQSAKEEFLALPVGEVRFINGKWVKRTADGAKAATEQEIRDYNARKLLGTSIA